MSDETRSFRPSDPAQQERLEAVLAEYLRRVEAGEEVDRQAILSEHPDLADDLREFFANQAHLARIVGHPQGSSSASSAPTRPMKVRYFGDYEILEEIAQGGMGVVYKARQVSLNRLVAVKMILAGQLANESEVKRFQAEAEAAANLRHPGVVPIYEVGIQDGQHYFSMEYVEGRTLSQLARDSSLSATKAAEYVREMAEIVQYAHDQGVLHRDLKPSNVLIDTDDRVRITDFGLAKRVTGDSDLTLTGQVIGTPSYMPPEQAAAQHTVIGTTADVYALGAILYELLTGRPPFRADNIGETLRQVQHDDPVRPRLLAPKLPRDLETICLKCLEKEPRRRYATAHELADELGRFLRGEPTIARPIGPMLRAWRWCRRNPVVAGLSVIALIASIAASAILLVSYLLVSSALDDRTNALAQRTRTLTKLATEEQHTREALQGKTRALNELEKSSTKLKESLDRLQQEGYFNGILLAWRECQAGHFEKAERQLEACRADLRGWEWHYISRLCHSAPSIATVQNFLGSNRVSDGLEPAGIRLSGDGSRLVIARSYQALLVLDASTGSQLFQLDVRHATKAVAISDDGQRLAALGDGSLTIWDTNPVIVRATRADLPTRYNRVEFSADATRLIASEQLSGVMSRDESLKRWCVLSATVLDADSGKSLASQGYGTSVPGRCAYSRDGRQIAVFRDRVATVTDYDSGLSTPMTEHAAQIVGGVFSPTGTTIATFDVESAIVVSNAKTGDRICGWSLRPEGIERLLFSADGSKLVSLSFLSTLYVHDVSSGQLLASHRESSVEREGGNPLATPSVSSVGPWNAHQFFALDSDGTQLASASGRHKLTVWNLASGQETTLRTREPLCFLAFDNGRKHRILYATQQAFGSLVFNQWNTKGQDESRLLYRPGPFYHTVAVNAAGTMIASIAKPRPGGVNTVKVWNIKTGNEVLSAPAAGGGELFEVAFSPDDSLLAMAGLQGVSVLDLATKETRSVVSEKVGRCHRVAFCRDGQRLVVAHNGGASIYELQSGKEIAQFDQPRWCASVSLNASESQIATAGRDGGVYIWNTVTGKRVHDLSLNASENHLYCVAFSPDARCLAGADVMGRIFVWDVKTGRQLLKLTGHGGRAYCVVFSRDGRRLMSMGDDGLLHVWESKSGREILTLNGHVDRVYGAAFTREGHQIVTTSADGTIRIWDGTPLQNPDEK
jgi:serine/threonine protein kinase/WD40 repeat protein